MINKNELKNYKNRNLEIVKWLIITMLSFSVIIGNYLYKNIYFPMRIFLSLCIIVIIFSILLITNKGRFIISFAREARSEINKVIWPTREETLYTTCIVISITVIMSLILWGLDTMLIHIVSYITKLKVF